MSTHNICFLGKYKKEHLSGYCLISIAVAIIIFAIKNYDAFVQIMRYSDIKD